MLFQSLLSLPLLTTRMNCADTLLTRRIQNQALYLRTVVQQQAPDSLSHLLKSVWKKMICDCLLCAMRYSALLMFVVRQDRATKSLFHPATDLTSGNPGRDCRQWYFPDHVFLVEPVIGGRNYRKAAIGVTSTVGKPLRACSNGHTTTKCFPETCLHIFLRS